MLLLEAVEMYGLGNWAAVAEHVGTKGEGACRGHYYAVYVDVPSFPEPAPLPAMLHVNQAQVRVGPRSRAEGPASHCTADGGCGCCCWRVDVSNRGGAYWASGLAADPC